MTLYGFNTTNSLKILIALYEFQIDFKAVCVLLDGDQFTKKFTKINPNQKTPVLKITSQNNTPMYLSESGAILNYLNQNSKTSKGLQILPDNELVMQWLMWQVSTQAPVTGNWFYFKFKTKNTQALERFEKEMQRQLNLVDQHLVDNEYLAGQFSIADIALFSWYHKLEKNEEDIKPFKNIKRWLDQINKRESVIKALKFDFNESINIKEEIK